MVQPRQEIHDLARARHILARGGLVHDQDLWPHHDDGRDREPLAVAPRELKGVELALVPQLEPPEDLLDGLLDLVGGGTQVLEAERHVVPDSLPEQLVVRVLELQPFGQDRKSTRLNSSHGSISYAVFCLKKKKQ